MSVYQIVPNSTVVAAEACALKKISNMEIFTDFESNLKPYVVLDNDCPIDTPFVQDGRAYCVFKGEARCYITQKDAAMWTKDFEHRKKSVMEMLFAATRDFLETDVEFFAPFNNKKEVQFQSWIGSPLCLTFYDAGETFFGHGNGVKPILRKGHSLSGLKVLEERRAVKNVSICGEMGTMSCALRYVRKEEVSLWGTFSSNKRNDKGQRGVYNFSITYKVDQDTMEYEQTEPLFCDNLSVVLIPDYPLSLLRFSSFRWVKKEGTARQDPDMQLILDSDQFGLDMMENYSRVTGGEISSYTIELPTEYGLAQKIVVEAKESVLKKYYII